MQDLADAGKLDSDGWAFVNSFNTERAHGGNLEGQPPLESGASQNDMDYLHVVNWKKAEELFKAGKTVAINGFPVIPLETAAAEGVLTFVPEPKSPHGADVTPDGKYVVVGGKLDTHATVFDFAKIKALIEAKDFVGKDPYGVPILDFQKSIKGQVELGLGPLHTVFDDKGNAYTSMFVESKIAKWSLSEMKLIEKLPVHYNIGHIAAAHGDTVKPQGHWVVAMNKWAIDRFADVGPLLPQNFQLVDVSGPAMQLVYDLPIPLGEPHYTQIIAADRIHAIDHYCAGGLEQSLPREGPAGGRWGQGAHRAARRRRARLHDAGAQPLHARHHPREAGRDRAPPRDEPRAGAGRHPRLRDQLVQHRAVARAGRARQRHLQGRQGGRVPVLLPRVLLGAPPRNGGLPDRGADLAEAGGDAAAGRWTQLDAPCGSARRSGARSSWRWALVAACAASREPERIARAASAPARPEACREVPPGAGLQAAIDAAPPGSALCLAPGTYAGPVRIPRPLTLWGPRDAVIRSHGEGTTVRLEGEGAALLGVTVDGSGGRYDLLDAAVHVAGRGGRVEGVLVRNAVFGILVERATDATVRGNQVLGDASQPLGLRGDGIRLWETYDSTVEDNLVPDSRDIVLWYASRNRVAGNRIERGRYGAHLMYSHGNQIVGNRFVGNVTGLFVMYSRDVEIRGNVFADSGGAAGMGLGLKESGNLRVRENLFVHNTIGVYVDTSPLWPDDRNRFEGNVFRLNGVAVSFLGRASGNEFAGQRLPRQPGAGAGGRPRRRAAGRLAGQRVRRLRGLRPRRRRHRRRALRAAQPGVGSGGRGAGAGLLSRHAGLRARRGDRAHRAALRAPPRAVRSRAAHDAAWRGRARVRIEVRGVSKRYGRVTALDGVSFELAPRSRVALVGPNGSGKSTLNRILMGLVACQGSVRLDGRCPFRERVALAREMAYVPQIAPQLAAPVDEVVRAIARVRGLSRESVARVAQRARARSRGDRRASLPVACRAARSRSS